MTKPGKSNPKSSPERRIRLVDADRVQIEFLIEDLIQQIGIDPGAPVANCNGCSMCSAAIDIPEVKTK